MINVTIFPVESQNNDDLLPFYFIEDIRETTERQLYFFTVQGDPEENTVKVYYFYIGECQCKGAAGGSVTCVF